MKITILQGAFLPVPPVMGGAVEKVWFEMGRQFAERGHEVTHVSRRHPDHPDREELDGVQHRRIAGFSTPRSLLALKLLDLAYTLRAVAQIPPDSEIIITNTFWAPLVVPLFRRGLIYVSVQRMPKGQMRFYRRAARWHVVSSAVMEAIRAELPGELARVVVIPNPLTFPAVGTIDRLLSAKERIILYAGRIHPEKGLELLIEALRQPSLSRFWGDWKIQIIGPVAVSEGGGGEPYLKELQALAEGLPVSWLAPAYDGHALQERYRKASIFVYPSIAERGETFGVSPLEAMACGTVPVVSDLACFRDFITSGLNGLVFDHRSRNAPHKLAVDVESLIRSPALRERLSRAAVQVHETHCPLHVSNLFLEDFSRLLAAEQPSKAVT